MKFLKSFLALILASAIISNSVAMEAGVKEAEVKKDPDYLSMKTDDMLKIILNFAIAGNRELATTESGIFKAVNNLRLVNKKFYSLINDYVAQEKKQAQEKYKNLTPEQAYKQFQTDLAIKWGDQKAKEFILSKGRAGVDTKTLFLHMLNNYEAFTWLENEYKKGTAPGSTAGSVFNSSTIRDINKDMQNDIVKNLVESSYDLPTIFRFIETPSSIQNLNLKKSFERYFKLAKIIDANVNHQVIKEVLKRTIINELFDPINYNIDKTIASFNEAIKRNAYDWINNDKMGKHLFQKYFGNLILNLNIDKIKQILENPKLKIDLNNKFITITNPAGHDINIEPLGIVIRNLMQGDKSNLDRLNNYYKLIQLLLQKGADPKLVNTQILKDQLKELESKMGYTVKLSGYGVPENIKVLRDIVKLLESSASKNLPKYGKLEDDWEEISK